MKNVFVLFGCLFIAVAVLADNGIYVCDENVICNTNDTNISFTEKNTSKGITGKIKQFDFSKRVIMEADVVSGGSGIMKLYTFWLNNSNQEEQKIKSEVPFKNNKINGTVKYYYENCDKRGKCGGIRKTQEIKDGNLHGWEKQYDRDGNLKIEKLYENNQIKTKNAY